MDGTKHLSEKIEGVAIAAPSTHLEWDTAFIDIGSASLAAPAADTF